MSFDMGAGAEPEEKTVVAESVPIPRPTEGTATRALLFVLAGPAIGNSYTVGPHAAVLGRGEGSEVLIQDSSISRQHARISRAENGFLIDDLGSANATFVDGVKVQGSAALREASRIQLGPNTVIKFTMLDALEADVQQRLHDAIHSDMLTGTGNRRYLEIRLRDEFAHAMRHRRPLCLLMMDIDHFKNVNDSHGHPAGDQVLRQLAAGLLAQVRAEDVVVRYGGEEFLILARDLPPAQGIEFAERLRDHVQRTPVALPGGGKLSITVSVGVAGLQHDRDSDSAAVIARADRALYEAKRRGRNRVELAD